MARSSQGGNTHEPIGAASPSNGRGDVDLAAQPAPRAPQRSTQPDPVEGEGAGARIATTFSGHQDGAPAADIPAMPAEAPEIDVPLAPDTDAVGFRCHIDQVADNQIEGWIARPERAGHRYIVALREGEYILARAIASRFRADLVTAGLGDGCHGFVLPMPPVLLDGEEHLLQVIEQETGFALNPEPIR